MGPFLFVVTVGRVCAGEFAWRSPRILDIKASDTDTSNLLSLLVPRLKDSSKPLPMVVDLACSGAAQLCKVLLILCGDAPENLTETLDNFQRSKSQQAMHSLLQQFDYWKEAEKRASAQKTLGSEIEKARTELKEAFSMEKALAVSKRLPVWMKLFQQVPLAY